MACKGISIRHKVLALYNSGHKHVKAVIYL